MTKRLDNIEKSINQNTDSIDKVQRITIKVNAENFMKLVTEIPVFTNQPVAVNEGGGGGGGGAG
jgi:hypothetical protein